MALGKTLLGLLSTMGLGLLSTMGLGFSEASPFRNRNERRETSAATVKQRTRERNRYTEMPRYYPGAKLARKAMNGTVGKATLR